MGIFNVPAAPGAAVTETLVPGFVDGPRCCAGGPPSRTGAHRVHGQPQLASESLSKLVLGRSTAEQAAKHVQQGIGQWFKPTQ
ncbi:hypothetical protein [Nonomuraea jabiensis]|uniref:hypothetical protein n=1 Tax=Nonomuraea jabiensis TaxID=882448 RepID=UPI003D7155C3